VTDPREDDYAEQKAEARADDWRYTSDRELDQAAERWEARHYA